MDPAVISILHHLFEEWCGLVPEQTTALPPSGSYRCYWRIQAGKYSALGVWNADLKENDAFLSFTRSFIREGLLVPSIYAEVPEKGLYLLEDLGSCTLFDKVRGEPFDASQERIYERCLEQLVDVQIKGRDCIDYGKCYPRAAFDRNSMMWDLNYFKYYFLKLVRIPFDEQALEDDFNAFVTYLQRERSDYFLFRDFQSANIMIREDKIYFIDYQGGRRGALQYDPASLLFDAKVQLPRDARERLIHHYMDVLEEKQPVFRTEFMHFYEGFVLIRLMQAMGAFGFRGIVEKKPGFMNSIPPALTLFSNLLETWSLPVDIPELKACFGRMLTSSYLNELLSGLQVEPSRT